MYFNFHPSSGIQDTRYAESLCHKCSILHCDGRDELILKSHTRAHIHKKKMHKLEIENCDVRRKCSICHNDALFIKISLVVGNATSEFVRQELRAIVGARTQQQQQQQQQQQRVPNNLQNNLSGQVSQDDLDALALTFEMPSAGMWTVQSLFAVFRNHIETAAQVMIN